MKKVPLPPLPRVVPAVEVRVWMDVNLYAKDPETNLCMAVSVEGSELKLNNQTDATIIGYWKELARIAEECGSCLEALHLVARMAYPIKKSKKTLTVLRSDCKNSAPCQKQSNAPLLS
jgi:hypothetical protein